MFNMISIVKFISALLFFRVTALGFLIPRQVGTRVRIRTGGGEGKESISPTAGELSSVDFFGLGWEFSWLCIALLLVSGTNILIM